VPPRPPPHIYILRHKILISINNTTTRGGNTPLLLKVNSICACKKEGTFILIVPCFISIFYLILLSDPASHSTDVLLATNFGPPFTAVKAGDHLLQHMGFPVYSFSCGLMVAPLRAENNCH
jgi:hypothetical protein